MPAPKKKFDGEVFRYIATYGSKGEAERQAKRQRQLGKYSVRIVKVSGGWAAYARKA